MKRKSNAAREVEEMGRALCLNAIETLRTTAMFCDIRGADMASSLIEVAMAANTTERIRMSRYHCRAVLDNVLGLTLYGEYVVSNTTSELALLVEAHFSRPDHLNQSAVTYKVRYRTRQTIPDRGEPEFEEIAEYKIAFDENGIPRLVEFECFGKMHADSFAQTILNRTLPCWEEAFFPDLNSWPEQENRLTEMLTPGYVLPALAETTAA